MNVVIFNLKNGENLGDHLIAECLEAHLKEIAPSWTITTADLAGRDRVPVSGLKRLAVLFALKKLPRLLRSRLAEFALRRLSTKTLKPKWRELLQGKDAVIIGGGGLFADNDLNFPIKIGTVLDMAAEMKLPVSIFSVGVTRIWSARGEAILTRGIKRTRVGHTSVRDRPSQDCWIEHFAGSGLAPPTLAPDPALLSARYYPRFGKAVGRKSLGLCVTSPTALAYHGEASLSTERVSKQYHALIAALRASGFDITLFTTGMSEDFVYLQSIRRSIPADVVCSGRFSSANELAGFVSARDAIVSHRLHALITAFSFAVPFVALSWDQKLLGQLSLMKYSARLCDMSKDSAATIAARVMLAYTEGVDAASKEQLETEAANGIAELVAAIESYRYEP